MWLCASLFYHGGSNCPLLKVSVLCLCNVLYWRLIISKLNRICDVLEFIWMIVHVVRRTHVYLWSKLVSLFCFVLMKSSKPGCFMSCSWSLWKALEERGCIGLVPWGLDLWCKSSWILNDFFTENKIKS
jgi:hypothetical protein